MRHHTLTALLLALVAGCGTAGDPPSTGAPDDGSGKEDTIRPGGARLGGLAVHLAQGTQPDDYGINSTYALFIYTQGGSQVSGWLQPDAVVQVAPGTYCVGIQGLGGPVQPMTQSCDAVVRAGETTHVRLGALKIHLDDARLAVTLPYGHPAFGVFWNGVSFLNDGLGPGNRPSTWHFPGWSRDATVPAFPGTYRFAYGDNIPEQMRAVAADEVVVVDATPVEWRTRLHVSTDPTAALPNPAGVPVATLDLVELPNWVHSDARVLATQPFLSNGLVDFLLYPSAGTGIKYVLHVNGLTWELPPLGAVEHVVSLKRIELEDPFVYNSDGTTTTVRGTYSIARDGQWIMNGDLRPLGPGEQNAVATFLTHTGVDVPPGHYKVDVWYWASPGVPKNEIYELDL